jgi:hypothetical protein
MDYVDLLSMLEESKFLRLFRYLIDEVQQPEDGVNTGNLTTASVPLDIPDVELHLKVVGHSGSLHSFAASWLFQIIHLPQFLWHHDFAPEFLHNQLKRGLENLLARPGVLKEMTRKNQNSRFHPLQDGYDYYLFTNICYGLDERSLNQFSTSAHNLCAEVLDIPRDMQPRFGIGTPETFARSGKQDVSKFLGDLINMPSSYYLLAREGAITVIPTTEYGSFLASHSDSRRVAEANGLATVITSSIPNARDEIPSLSDFESLLNDHRTKEADFQFFLEKNPHFLFALDERYCDIRPHVCLFDAKNERLVPDFMVRIQDTGIWNVIELKRPQHVLTVSDSLTEKASAPAARAIAELLHYRDYFSVRNNRNLVANKFGTAPYEPCLVLVIGRGQPARRYEWRSIRSGFPSVQIVSYDYLFQRARDCKIALSK